MAQSRISRRPASHMVVVLGGHKLRITEIRDLFFAGGYVKGESRNGLPSRYPFVTFCINNKKRSEGLGPIFENNVPMPRLLNRLCSPFSKLYMYWFLFWKRKKRAHPSSVRYMYILSEIVYMLCMQSYMHPENYGIKRKKKGMDPVT